MTRVFGLFDVSWISKPRILMAIGAAFILLGLISINPFSSLRTETLFLSLGGVFLAASIPLHYEVSRKSSLQEKTFVIVLCASVILLMAAIAAYTVVDTDYGWYETAFGKRGFLYNDVAATMLDPRRAAPPAGVGPTSIPTYWISFTVAQVYSGYANSLLMCGLVLLALSIYIKERFL